MTSGANGTATSLSQEVLRYAAGVRAELADLTPAQRDDLFEDLEDHLSEVAAELDEPLQSRLGPPEIYAAELRASAGIAPAMPQPGCHEPDESLLGLLGDPVPARLPGRVAAGLVGPAGLLVAIVLASDLRGVRRRGPRDRRRHRLGDAGPADAGSARPWVLADPVNVLAVIAASCQGSRQYQRSSTTGNRGALGRAAKTGGAPRRVIGARGRDADHEHLPVRRAGQPLSGVRLYDQNGRPITNVSNVTEDGEADRSHATRSKPNGLRVRNAYPQELVDRRQVWAHRTRGPVPSSHPHRQSRARIGTTRLTLLVTRSKPRSR